MKELVNSAYLVFFYLAKQMFFLDWEIKRTKINLVLTMCVNTYFDTICVHLLENAYTCVEMRTIKLTDKLEFILSYIFYKSCYIKQSRDQSLKYKLL